MSRLKNVEEQVDLIYGSHNPNADPWSKWGYENHVLVVAKKAEELARKYNANIEYCITGALLHDIADAITLRADKNHEEKSRKLAREILEKAGFEKEEADYIIEKMIVPHSCRELLPETLDGKVLATADSFGHLGTEFYLYFSWMHYGASEYQEFKNWVFRKIERDFHRKIFFGDEKKELEKNYMSLKIVFELGSK